MDKYFKENNLSTLLFVSLLEHTKEFKPELQTAIDAIEKTISNYLESLTSDILRVFAPAWGMRTVKKIDDLVDKLFAFFKE